MKRFLKKAASAVAIAAAAAGVAVLPASSAHADPQLLCPRVVAVCTWTEPSGRGELRLLFEGREVILPPVRSAQNQTFEPWCFYETLGFNAQTETYENLVKAGVIDPTKVVRAALQDAASVAGLLITTEATVAELPEDKPAPAMPGGMGGMGGMDF